MRVHPLAYSLLAHSPLKMKTQFAVNYSKKASRLRRDGVIPIDYYKIPAWDSLIPDVMADHNTYVHFPLVVGDGVGDAVNSETHQVADWSHMESILTQTNTPYINLHLGASLKAYPDITCDSIAQADMERVLEATIRDTEAVVRRFGADKVIVENIPGGRRDNHLQLCAMPEFINGVVEATGCGLLLDISHARLSAHQVGWDVKPYINSLPVHRLRELHITGVQEIGDSLLAWIRNLIDAGLYAPHSDEELEAMRGEWIDHVPMIEWDWPIMEWAAEMMRNGRWASPWVVSLEYGGVGKLFEAVTETAVLTEQVPRLYEIFKREREMGE